VINFPSTYFTIFTALYVFPHFRVATFLPLRGFTYVVGVGISLALVGPTLEVSVSTSILAWAFTRCLQKTLWY